MKKHALALLALVALFIFLTGCAGGNGYKNPPSYGVFLVSQRNLVEIPTGEFVGLPYKTELANAPSTSNMPMLVFNNPNLNLSYLQFFYIDGRDELAYSATPKNNGIVEIRPKNPLSPGNYCFFQGDPLSAVINGWCFLVEGTAPAAGSSTNGPSSSNAPFGWIPAVFAGVLALLLVAISVVFWRSGKLQAWSAAGFSASKWNVQSLKLNSDQGRLQRDIETEVNKLGKLAWETRIQHPAYADVYSQLEELEAKKVERQNKIIELDNLLKGVNQTRSEKNTDYTNRIAELQNRKRADETNLNSLNAKITTLHRQIHSAQNEAEKAANEMEAMRKRADSIQNSNAADKSEQTEKLTSAIAVLAQAHETSKLLIPDYQAEVSRIQAQVSPLSSEIEDLGKQITGLLEEQRNTIAPLNNQIKDIQENIRKLDGEISAISSQTTPCIKQLGAQVDQSRPQAQPLAGQYAQIDKLNGDLNNIVRQNNLLKARLSASDPKAVRNFFILGAVYFVIILAILILLIAAAL